MGFAWGGAELADLTNSWRKEARHATMTAESKGNSIS